MSKGNTFENDVLLKTFQATEFSWDANTDLYVSLHETDPGEAGSQLTGECGYGSYARQTISRSASGWDVAGNVASNDDLIQFPTSTVLDSDAAYIAIGTSLAGAGQILYSGALNSPIPTNVGIQPQFAANALTITED
jgi:hypothetical protein